MIQRYIQQIRCYFGMHEYRGAYMWEILERQCFESWRPHRYEEWLELDEKMMDSMDRYENECIHCKRKREELEK